MDKEFLIDIKPNIEIPEYELILCKPNEEYLISIKIRNDLEHKPYFANNIDELSFSVPFYRMESDGTVVKHEVYDLIKGDYLILLNDKKYFIIDEVKEVEGKEGKIYKHVHCYSREYELKNKLISGYKGESRLIYDYFHSVDENGLEVGFFNYIEKITSWRVGYISPIILLKYRGLELSNNDILTSLKDIQKAFGCIFQFNTVEKIIDILPDVDGTDYMVMQKIKLDSAIKYLERIINISIKDSSILRSELNVILIALDYLKEEMKGIVEISNAIGITNDVEYINFINAINDIESLIMSWDNQTIFPIDLSHNDLENIKNKFTLLYDTLPPLYSAIDIYDATQIGNNQKFYISNKNFLQSLSKNINSNDIKTRIYLYGKDDVSIQEYNIIGKPYLERYNFYKTTEYMEQDLIDALNDYEAFVETKRGLFNGYLAVLKKKNSELSTLKIELTTLQTDLKIIKAELDIAKATGQPTTELESLERNKLNEISSKNTQIQVVEDDISSVRASINKLGQDTNITNHLTDEQLRKLDPFIKMYEFRDSNYTEDTLEDFIIEGQRLLYKKSQPAIQFELGVVDFFSLIEGYHVRKIVKLGDTILLYNEELGFDYEVRFIGYVHKPDSKELKLFLSNTNDMNDTNLYYTELFSKFNKTNQDVNQNKDVWNKAQEAYNAIVDVFSDNQITNIEANSLRVLCDNMRSEAIEVRDIASKLNLTSRQEYTDCGTAMALLQTEVNKWINKTDYPLPVTTQEREDITSAFQNLEVAIANLYNVINVERDNLTRDYVDVGIGEVNSQITEIRVNIAYIDEALIKKADINDLRANEARINDLYAVKATVTDLQATNARISTLEVGYADISVLEADVARINTLLAGNLDATNMKAGLITATSGLIANLAITNAMIANMSASKIDAGELNTNIVTVRSTDGNLRIQGNTLKVWDNTGKERVSLGLNGTDYNLLVRGKDGTTVLFGADGVTNAGITEGAVDDSKVSPNANISGDKLNISSVVTAINNGITRIESSNINYDGKSLNVAFNELETKTDDMQADINTRVKTTDFTIEQGKINTLISDVSTVQGEVNSTKSRVSTVEQTVSTFGVKISNLETDNNTTKSNLSALTQDVNSFKTTVSSTYTTKNEFKALEVGVRNLVLNSAEVVENSNYNMKTYTMSENWEVGKTYTLTIKGKVAPNKRFGIWQNAGSSSRGFFPIDQDGIASLTFTAVAPTSGWENRFTIYHYPSGTSGVGSIEWIKLERGSKSTGWTPAPEDQEAYVNETVNTAKSQMEQYADNIKLSVEQTTANTYETKLGVDQKINTAKGEIKVTTDAISSRVANVESDTGNLKTRMNTAEQKITPSAIMQTVQQQVSAGGTTIAQKSDITQTMDAWTAKFNYLKAPIPFRYVRSSMKSQYGIAAWTEIEVYANGINIARGKTVTASKTPASGALSLYTNGDNNLAGATNYVLLDGLGTSYGWLKVDLGSVVENVESILDYIPSEIEYDYKLEVSRDNINWTPIFVGKSSSKINSFGLSGFEQGVIKMNGKDGIIVKHSDDWSQYSQVKFDKFVRKYPYGEATYLNGISVHTEAQAGGSSTTIPDNITIPLPKHFAYRTNLEFVIVPTTFWFFGVMGTTNQPIDSLGQVTNIVSKTLNSTSPTVTVKVYTEVKYLDGSRRYYPSGFQLLIIGG